jgi:hypothetical protein
MILILVMEDGTTRQMKTENSIATLIRAVEKSAVETIVFGDVGGGVVHWEKQFKAVDVMPTSFGKR